MVSRLAAITHYKKGLISEMSQPLGLRLLNQILFYIHHFHAFLHILTLDLHKIGTR